MSNGKDVVKALINMASWVPSQLSASVFVIRIRSWSAIIAVDDFLAHAEESMVFISNH